MDHHPYGISGPTWHAFNVDDVAVPDIYKIARVVHAAVRSGHALPRSPKALWVAEFGWSSAPPNPKGVPVLQDARWYEQALYVLWRQGMSVILPLELADPAGISNYEAVFESGLYYSDGRPKPIATAFAFPFIAHRVSRDEVSSWGRAPQSGRATIQVLRHGRWAGVASLSIRAGQVFVRAFSLRGASSVRASMGRQVSLSWRVAG